MMSSPGIDRNDVVGIFRANAERDDVEETPVTLVRDSIVCYQRALQMTQDNRCVSFENVSWMVACCGGCLAWNGLRKLDVTHSKLLHVDNLSPEQAMATFMAL